MDDNESPVQSFKVGLGTSVSPDTAKTLSERKPWVLLICSDLGCTTGSVQRLSAATLNEFFSTNKVIIEGNVTEGLPEDIDPFHIEYRITDVKDFSPRSLAENLPLLQQLKQVSELLNGISRKSITPEDGFARITAMNLPQSIVRLLGDIRIQPGSGPAAAARNSAPASAGVDSILSMVDVGEKDDSTASVSSQPADLVAALSGGSAGEVSSAALLKCKESVDRLVADMGTTVARQPFFRAAGGSWQALKSLLKIAGRNRDIRIFVHSAPYDAAQRHFADALSACAAECGVPDLVVWDYPVTTDTATMQQLEHIGSQADRYKAIVVTSLDYHDELYLKILDREPLEQVMEQSAYIPLRRLRESAAARCLTVCAPDASVVRGQSGLEIAVPGGWLFAMQWLTSVIELQSPFHLQNSSLQIFDMYGFPKLPREVVFDGFRCGITILHPGTTTTPRVLMGDADSPYGSLLFNLLVNRVARQAAEWIGAQDRSVSAEDAAPLLEAFLRSEFAPYHILSSEGAVTVAVVEQQSLQVTIDSSDTVAGFPVRFQFSFNFRQ